MCISVGDGVSPTSRQTLTLSIATQALVMSSPAVSSATSNTPNLGPITIRRQTGSGTPITAGGPLTVDLTSSPSNGATFGMSQFTSVPVTTVIIPPGQSSATFWLGMTTPGTPTITASATGLVPGTQVETITTAPAGLGILLAAGSTGSPSLSCGPPGVSDTCNVTGVGGSGTVAFSVAFWNSGKVPVPYSATQASTINETGHGTGSVKINAAASSSSPTTLTASLGVSMRTFGPYTLTVDVSS